MNAFRMIGESIAVALRALRGNWMRTLLAVLGVGVGAGVVVTVAAVVTGIRTEIVGAIESAGPDNFTVMPFDFSNVRIAMDGSGRPPWWDRPEITEREIQRMASLPAVDALSAFYEFDASMRFRSEWIRIADWIGTSAAWTIYNPGALTAGRNFTQADIDMARPVLIMSTEAAQVVFGDIDPIGKRVRVNAGRRAANEAFTVIGVYDREDNPFGEVDEHFVAMPYTTADKRLKARHIFTFLMVQVTPDSTAARGEAENQIITTLRSMRGLEPADENNFAIIRSDMIAELFDNFTGMFFAVMMGLSSVGMLVGGIGVVGIMLISVTERTREIGIRKAIGATSMEIKWQFLAEASILTALGAGMGLLIGWGASETISGLTPLPAVIPLWSVFAALGLATLTGIVFGMLPALRAARLDPVDALRYE